jgi:hypothetical protein
MARKRSASGDREDRLAAVRKKLKETDMGGDRGFWKPKQGRNIVRILPGVGEMDMFFWQDVGKHYIPGSRRSYTCPSFTLGDPCPICEFVGELYDDGSDASKALAKDLRVRKQFWMNIVLRGKEDMGPLIYTPGVTVFRSISGMISDPDYGEIYDPYEGVDVTISREGTGVDTKYEVRAKRRESPLHEDEDVIDEWLDEKAKDLSVVELTDNPGDDEDLMQDAVVYVYPYGRLAELFEELDVAVEEEDDEEETPFPDEDEEEESPARRAIRKKRAERSKRRRR